MHGWVGETTFCDFSAGWWSGLSTVGISHPLETIKVRMQVLGDCGLVATARTVLHQQGIHGLYRGIAISTFLAATNNSICFGIYSMIHSYGHLGEGRLARCEHGSNIPFLHAKLFASGMAAGLTNVALSCPIELIKIRQQIHGSNPGQTPLKILVQVFNAKTRKSLKNFYLGVGPMCLRDGPALGSFIVIQEHVECLLRRQLAAEREICNWATFVSGGLAGVSYLLIGFPFDVVKSRLMSDRLDRPVYKNMFHCFRKIRNSHGLRIFFHGGLPATIRAFLVSAVGLVVYDNMSERCQRLGTFF